MTPNSPRMARLHLNVVKLSYIAANRGNPPFWNVGHHRCDITCQVKLAINEQSKYFEVELLT